MLEDAAYSRLMRLYYRKEQPIPADVATACRLIRATSKDERRAVEAVLSEFFRLADDGWHQKRCDTDIARFQAKAERNREVGKLGGRPRKTKTQQEPTNNHGGFPQEPTQNPPQSPVTRPQTPNPNTGQVVAHPPESPAIPETPTTWEHWREWFDSEQGVGCDPHSIHDRAKFRPLAMAWVNAGVTLGQMRAAVAKARQTAKEPIAYLPGYVDRVLADLTSAQAPPRETAWQQGKRELVEEATGGMLSRRRPTTTIIQEATDATPLRLG